MLLHRHCVHLFRRLALVLLGLAACAGAEPLSIKEERLGAWHYLFQPDAVENGVVMNYNLHSPPMAVVLGDPRESIAVLVPRSKKIAEFRAGVFTDLLLPEECVPLSLAVDRQGQLSALVELGRYRSSQKDWRRRFVIHRGSDGWAKPIEIPHPEADRIEFDAANSLWAFGRKPLAAVLTDGRWSTYRYSDDRRTDFCPLRMADDGPRVVLFSGQPPYPFGKFGRMKGVLAWRDGRYTREPDTSPDPWLARENARLAQLSDDSSLERTRGYVAHWDRTGSTEEPRRTIVRAGGCVLVSFGKAGLAWADEQELADSPALRSDEWETVPDVTVRPALDPAGNLWIGRGTKLIKISAEGSEEMKGDLPNAVYPWLDFDALGRPWVLAYARPVAVCRDGALVPYSGLIEALRAENPAFAPGRIFRFAIKTPAGLIALCDGPLENFTLLEGAKTRTFHELQINPKYIEPHIAHGYRPFRGGEPWYDARGRIYTMLNERSFCYDPVRRRWSPSEQGATSVLPPLEAPAWRGTISSAKERPVRYHSFHFFAVTKEGERQLDFGLNPLAHYVSWSGCPSGHAPVVEPGGRIWICRRGSKPGEEEWLVLKK